MRFMTFVAGLALLAPSASFAQQAAPAPSSSAQRLGNCFVLKSTGEDRLELMQWLVAALASTPRLKDVANVDPIRKSQLDKRIAAIMTRLMTVDCLAEAKAVAKGNDREGFNIAGQELGQIAAQELFGDPDGARALSGYAEYLHPEDFAPLLK